MRVLLVDSVSVASAARLVKKALALVVVAEGEAALVGQIEMARKVGDAGHDFADQLFDLRRSAGIELAEVVVLEPQQRGEHRHRRGRRRAVVAVADGGVEAGAGLFLDFFQRREQPAEAVGGAGVVWIEHR
jgi:hypothetical protein